MTQKCGADTPVREKLTAKMDEGKPTPVGTTIAHLASLFMATLREIFDESAYQRFLTKAQVSSSTAAYHNFLREREGSKARRPRCC